MILWTVTGMIHVLPHQSSSEVPFPDGAVLFWDWGSFHLHLYEEEKGVSQHNFFSGCCLSSRLPICPLPRRIVVLYGSGPTKSGRSLLCCVRGIVWSIRYWRWGLGMPSQPSPSTWEMSSPFSSFYLRDVTHRHLDIFSIGSVVAGHVTR